MKCEQHDTWQDTCHVCKLDHMNYHIRNEDLYDNFDLCPLCGPNIRERKWKEAQQRKRDGIEKRKKTLAAKKLLSKKKLV